MDRSTAADALEAAYVDGDTAELTLAKAEPDISQADVQDALNDFANPAVSGPVTLVFDTTRVTLRPADFSPALGMKPEDGALVPDLDEKKLAKLVRSRFARTDGAPVDATVEIVNGKPRVVPAKPGVDYDPSDISSAFLELVVKDPGQREMKVKATVKDADFTTKDARALGIKERVSTFTTYYPYAEYRNINIGRAAELVNGTLLKPGETFSLNDTVGERTAENGFTKGFIISDGVFKEDFGGGVSQMATTTFNAMFFAGLEDVEHKPHSFYIDRYPVGREATVAWGAVDLRFKNDTDHGVLIQANVTPATPSTLRRRDGVDVVDQDLGHHHEDRQPLQLHAREDPPAVRPRVRAERRLRRLRHQRVALLPRARRVRAGAHREVPHDVHALRHGDLRAREADHAALRGRRRLTRAGDAGRRSRAMAEPRLRQPFSEAARGPIDTGVMSPSSFVARLRRRHLSLIAAAAAVPLAVGALQAIPAGAAPQRAAVPQRPAVPADPSSTHQVTLVTGDVVTVTTMADGKPDRRRRPARQRRRRRADAGDRQVTCTSSPTRPWACSARTSSTGGCSTSPT